MKTAVFVMSYENGVGKGLLIDKVAELFGEYYTPITTKDQKSDFNEYMACKLLSVCDEATYTGRLDLAEAKMAVARDSAASLFGRRMSSATQLATIMLALL